MEPPRVGFYLCYRLILFEVRRHNCIRRANAFTSLNQWEKLIIQVSFDKISRATFNARSQSPSRTVRGVGRSAGAFTRSTGYGLKTQTRSYDGWITSYKLARQLTHSNTLTNWPMNYPNLFYGSTYWSFSYYIIVSTLGYSIPTYFTPY